MSLKQRKAAASQNPKPDKSQSATSVQRSATPNEVYSFTFLLVIGGIFRLTLIAYGSWHDSRHALKYTDIDYTVFSDAATFILRPTNRNKAGGPLAGTIAKLLGLEAIGCPYKRATYRYTPLLALLLLLNGIVHSEWGKFLFAVGDLLVAAMLHRILTTIHANQVTERQSKIYVSIVWLLNPFVANISTRGSAESLLGVVVLASLLALTEGRNRMSAMFLGLAIHFKLYPIIYGLPTMIKLATPGNSLLRVNNRQVSYMVWTATTFAILNIMMYAVWGDSFLAQSYLYHLTRMDHRHNFSYHFYDLYLGFTTGAPPSWVEMRELIPQVLGSSFVPQFGAVAVIGASLALHRAMPLSFIWFLQTFAFVAFNRVCTSQYFMWYLWFVPLVIPHYRQLKLWIGLCLLAIWVASQAVWLAIAYRLELEGQPLYLELWVASVVFFASQIVLIWLLLRYFWWQKC